MALLKKKILELERGSTRSICVKNSLGKIVWTCRTADYVMNEIDNSDYKLALNNETGNKKRNCVEGSISGLTGVNNLKLGETEKSHEISQPR
jgi:hypothetical protein